MDTILDTGDMGCSPDGRPICVGRCGMFGGCVTATVRNQLQMDAAPAQSEMDAAPVQSDINYNCDIEERGSDFFDNPEQWQERQENNRRCKLRQLVSDFSNAITSPNLSSSYSLVNGEFINDEEVIDDTPTLDEISAQQVYEYCWPISS